MLRNRWVGLALLACLCLNADVVSGQQQAATLPVTDGTETVRAAVEAARAAREAGRCPLARDGCVVDSPPRSSVQDHDAMDRDSRRLLCASRRHCAEDQ